MTNRAVPETMIEIEITTNVVLYADSVWPDGDWPDEITADDVIERMENSTRDVADLINKWDLDGDAEVKVWVEGNQAQPWY